MSCLTNSKKTIAFSFILSFFLTSFLSAGNSILLVNQTGNQYLTKLQNLSFNINSAFQNKLELNVILSGGKTGYIPISEDETYLQEARTKNCGFIVVNTFAISEQTISIESKIYNAEQGEMLFNLSSSGSTELGLEEKINFIIRKINQRIDQTIEEAIKREDLFTSIFGNQEKVVPEIDVPLFINEYFKGTIKITPGEESIEIAFQELYDYLRPLCTEELLSKIESLNPENGMVTGRDMDNTGISWEYNDTELYLKITIPPELKKISSIMFRKGKDFPDDEITEQAPFSAYLNIFYDQQWLWNSIGEANDHQFPGSVTFLSALNVYDWVLDADYTLDFPFTGELPSVSITHDFTSIRSRLILGHYPVVSRGYQAFGYYQGISFSSIAEIGDSADEKDPLYEFTVESPSFLKILVNGNTVKGINIDPGRYNLTDFPLLSGVNEIELILENRFGEEEVIAFEMPFDSNALAKGDIDYSVSAGIPPYTLELPLLTGNFRYGFFDFMTGGISIQSDLETELAGLNLIFPTLAGTFSIEGAQSWSAESGLGFAAGLTYSFTPVKNSNIPSLALSARYKSPAFYPVNANTLLEPDIAEIQALLSYSPGGFIQLTPKGAVRFGRGDSGISGSFTMGIRKKFEKDISGEISIKADFYSDAEPDLSASLFLRIQDQKKGDSLSVQMNTDRKGPDINWNKSINGSNNGTLTAGLSGLPYVDDTGSTLYLGGNMNLNRFTTTLYSSLSRSDSGEFSSSLQGKLSTALVYADRHFAISKPVSNSFAIIVPRYNLEGIDLGVNPDTSGYESRSDFLGNPVLHNLAPYNFRQITVNVTDPHVGIDMETGNSVFNLFPRFKSGTVIYTGTLSDVYLTGRLVDEKGNPLPYETGVISNDEGDSQMFFTDREGVFFIYELQRGVWNLEVNKSTFVQSITIPEETEKKIDIGDVVLHEK